MLIPEYVEVQAPMSYLWRQAEIANLATGFDSPACEIEYTAEEHATWHQVQTMLEPLWHKHAALPLRSAKTALGLPNDQIPQLSLVSERLRDLTRFAYISVPGTVPGHDFFGALAERTFSSTQFIRWSGSPLYTPAPDVLHEVGGHAVSLANPKLAELHQLAGLASLAAPSMLTSIAAVFWYSLEFGVVQEQGEWKAYGAGLLSSPGELAWFAKHATVQPLNIAAMVTTPYDISRYQPTLFGAESLDHLFDVVGGFYRDVIERVSPSLPTNAHERTTHVSP